MSQTIFNKTYDGENVYDLLPDIIEAFDPKINENAKSIPIDEHGIRLGSFIVTIQHTQDNNSEKSSS